MAKKLKALKITILTILIILIGLLVLLSLYGGQMIKGMVEKVASKTLGVDVEIDAINFSLLGGSIAIKGLEVGNPQGYKIDNLLELDSCKVVVNIGSVFSDTVEIEQIKIDGIRISIEQKGFSNNLNDIIKALPSPKEREAEAKVGRNLKIADLEITNTEVTLKLIPIVGQADTITIKLDPIVMKNLGTDEKIDVAVLVSKIMVAISKGVAKQGTGVFPSQITDPMKTTLKRTTELGEAATKRGKQVIEAGEEVIEGLQGLFKKKD